MDSLKIVEKLELCPIISAVHEPQFNDALSSPCEIVFLLEGDVMTVGQKIDVAHKSGKLIFVHIDLMKGIGKDKCGVQFLANLGVDGIINLQKRI